MKCTQGHSETAKVLLDAGADVNAKEVSTVADSPKKRCTLQRSSPKLAGPFKPSKVSRDGRSRPEANATARSGSQHLSHGAREKRKTSVTAQSMGLRLRVYVFAPFGRPALRSYIPVSLMPIKALLQSCASGGALEVFVVVVL